MDFAALLEGIQHVARETVIALEPAYVGATRPGAPRQDAQVHGQGRIEAEVRQSLLSRCQLPIDGTM